LKRAILERTNLGWANLQGTDLTEAVFDGANLTGVELRSATGLDCERLKRAQNWEKAYRDQALSCGSAIPESPQEEKDQIKFR
jgi:uncharacterized protein YjbI with pentapeptide repeats